MPLPPALEIYACERHRHPQRLARLRGADHLLLDVPERSAFGAIPEDDYVRALITRSFATIETGLTAAIAYFIGSSRGSKASGDAVRKLAEQAHAK
jgi:hypothetical protein